MSKFQMGLIALLIGCVAFISCDVIQEILTPAPPEEDMPDDDMMPTDDMLAGLPMYIAMYTSWATNVTYPGPVGTGGVHGEGARTVYINDVGAMALQDESLIAYPAGTIIVKQIMDDANMFVQKVATMMKTDDPMYASHNGWTYKKYARPDENADYMQVKGDGLPDAAEGCHACHAAAPIDSVFVFPIDAMDGEDQIADMPIKEIDVLIEESDPVQVSINVVGYLSDSCTAHHETHQGLEGNTITIQITTIRPADAVCAAVVTEHQEVVALGMLPAGDYKVIVNDMEQEFRVD